MVTLTVLEPAQVLRPPVARVAVTPGRARSRIRPTLRVQFGPYHRDELYIVEAVTERPLALCRGIKQGPIAWPLNDCGSLSFSCSTANPLIDQLVDSETVRDGAGQLLLVGREVQWFRDGVLYFSGPLVTASPNLDGTITFGARDLLWHLFRKFFGAAERTDIFAGIGSMDTPGLPGWEVIGSAVKTRDTSDKVRGDASMALTGEGSVVARALRPAIPAGESTVFHFTAQVKIPAEWIVGTPILTFRARSVVDGNWVIVDSDTLTVAEDQAGHGWQQITTSIAVTVGLAAVVEAELFSTGVGTPRFDDIRAMRNDTTGTPDPAGEDTTHHGVSAVRHLETGKGQAPGHGIRARIDTLSGTVERLGERHLNHTQFQDFCRRYTDRAEGGWDFWPDFRTRTIVFGRRRGVDHVNLRLDSRNVHAGGWDHDETDLAAKIVVPGESDGVDRAEGGYTDTSRTRGIMYDRFHQPPDGTALSALDPMAFQVWDQYSQPQESPDGLVVSSDLIDTITPGDRIPSDLVTGKIRFGAGPAGDLVRIAQVVFNPETDRLELS